MVRPLPLERMVEDLESFSASGFDRATVDAYLAETTSTPESLARYLHYDSTRYTRHLVHKSPEFELLILCWSPGQRAPIHGHEGELCWARVERGRLRFKNYEIVSEDPLELAPLAEPVVGEAGFVDGPADIHAVENPASFETPAASLHLYSKPYGECDVYDGLQGPRRRVKLAYDTIRGEPAGSPARS